MKYPLAKPYLTSRDRDAVNEVLSSATLSRGPKLKEFEQAFSSLHQCQYASAVSSGTAGLILGLQALGVGPGDEVVTVSFTVPATVNSILVLGAVAKMIDIEEDTLGMCPHELQKAITSKTKAIVVVHAFGKAANISAIMDIASQHGIAVIEDACEAIGNQLGGQVLGSFADLGVFGFYPNKQITTGEGGMIVTQNQDIYQKVELLKNHGRSMSGEWLDQECVGWNFRLSEINSALGLSQIQQLDEIIAHRQRVAQSYNKNLQALEGVVCPQFSAQQSSSAWFVYVIRVDSKLRDRLFDRLMSEGIQCGKYFAPVHLQPAFASQNPQHLPLTETVASQSLALPFYPQLQNSDVVCICKKMEEILNALKN